MIINKVTKCKCVLVLKPALRNSRVIWASMVHKNLAAIDYGRGGDNKISI